MSPVQSLEPKLLFGGSKCLKTGSGDIRRSRPKKRFKIRIAKSEEERAAIFRFRYKVFVREMNLFHDSADHETESLADEHDPNSHLVYAADGDRIIGAARITWGGDAPFSREFRETYDLPRFEAVAPRESVMVVTRLGVEKGFRCSKLTLLLMRFCANFAKGHGAHLTFCDCQPHLLRLYQSLGFRPYTHTYNDPSYGIMVPLVNIATDAEHLAKVRSPVAKIFSGWNPPANLEEIRSLIPVSPPVRQVQGSKSGGTRDKIRSLADTSEGARFGLFDGFSEAETDALLARSHVITCNCGDFIIREGTVMNTVFSIVEGELEVVADGKSVCTMKVGECFGELSLLHNIPRTANVIVNSGRAVVLSLSETNLHRLISGESGLASKFLLNLARSLAMKLLGKQNHSQ